MTLATATVRRHQSYGFICERERSPGEWGMRKLDTPRLTEIVEEYEDKAHLLVGDTREIVERLAGVGREELKQRRAEEPV